jgi:hypothetical protein
MMFTFLNSFLMAIPFVGIKNVDCRVKKFYLTGQVLKHIHILFEPNKKGENSGFAYKLLNFTENSECVPVHHWEVVLLVPITQCAQSSILVMLESIYLTNIHHNSIDMYVSPAFLEHGSEEKIAVWAHSNRDPNKQEVWIHFCMKRLKTLNSHKIFKIKIKN